MFIFTTSRIFHFFKQKRHLCNGLILKDSKAASKKLAVLNSKKMTKKKPRKKHVIKRVSDDIEAIWLENLNSGNLSLYRKTSYVLNLNSKAIYQTVIKKTKINENLLIKLSQELKFLSRVRYIILVGVGNISYTFNKSTCSFRKINLQTLFERLKEIYPATLGTLNFNPVSTSPKKDDIQPVAVLSAKTTNWSKSEDVQVPLKENVNQSESSSCTETKIESESEKVQASPYLSEYLIKHIMDFPLLKSQCSKSLDDFFKDEIEDFGIVDSVTFPSVTGILNETMPDLVRFKLKQWKDRMIAELGLQGFYKYQRDLLTQGSKFHSTVKTYLEVRDKSLVKIDPQIEGCWKSLENFLPDVSDVRFVEESVYHPILMYKGVVDCVATFRGTPCVIEWKKSSKVRSDISETYDAPIQLCAYLGALPWHKNLTIEKGLVVVVYNDGTPANVFNLSLESCEFYWLEWLRRLQTYWLKKSSTIIQQEV